MTAHALAQNHNGDPACSCGYEPQGAATLYDAYRMVRRHREAPRQPVCPDCGPLSTTDGHITGHHCPGYSNRPSIDGVPHATGPAPHAPEPEPEPEPEAPGYWETTGNLRVHHPARQPERGADQ